MLPFYRSERIFGFFLFSNDETVFCELGSISNQLFISLNTVFDSLPKSQTIDFYFRKKYDFFKIGM